MVTEKTNKRVEKNKTNFDLKLISFPSCFDERHYTMLFNLVNLKFALYSLTYKKNSSVSTYEFKTNC
jgi:hypothetical protein